MKPAQCTLNTYRIHVLHFFIRPAGWTWFEEGKNICILSLPSWHVKTSWDWGGGDDNYSGPLDNLCLDFLQCVFVISMGKGRGYIRNWTQTGIVVSTIVLRSIVAAMQSAHKFSLLDVAYWISSSSVSFNTGTWKLSSNYKHEFKMPR